MATAPYLVRDGGELKLDVSVGQSGRRQFALSDRATTLLVDELELDDRDVVPWLVAKTLALAGGLYLRDEKTDPRELSWQITGADGGADASAETVERLADYLRAVEVDEHAVETVHEHVRETRLSTAMSVEDVESKRDRTRDLRDIARDL